MNPDDQNLEQLLHEKLTQLPAPRAPRTLMPRVLAEVRRRAARPWYQRAWFTWSRHWQVASGLAMAALLAGFVLFVPELNAGATVRELGGRLAASTEDLGVGLNTVLLLWRTLVQPVIWYLVAFAAAMVAAGTVCGTALGRVLARERYLA